MQMVLYGIYYKRDKPTLSSRNIIGPSKPGDLSEKRREATIDNVW